MSSQNTGTSSPTQLRIKRPYPRPLNQPAPSVSTLYPPSSASTSTSTFHPSSSSSSAPPTSRNIQLSKAYPPSSLKHPQHPGMMRNRSLLQPLGALDIPVPPSLQNSPLLQSPESVFRRPYPNTRSPGEEEERWLRDTVPMSIGSANSQIPGSSSGSLRRKDGEKRNSVASIKSPIPPPSGIGTVPTRNARDGLPPSSSSTSVTSGTHSPAPARSSNTHSFTSGRGEKKGERDAGSAISGGH